LKFDSHQEEGQGGKSLKLVNIYVKNNRPLLLKINTTLVKSTAKLLLASKESRFHHLS